jgi:hypothetical protein
MCFVSGEWRMRFIFEGGEINKEKQTCCNLCKFQLKREADYCEFRLGMREVFYPN